LPTALTEPAPAKINLYLAVGPRRSDGYHDILTLFETLPLADEVRVLVGAAVDGRTRVTVDGAGPGLSPGDIFPRDLDNLAGRAAELYLSALTGEDVSRPRHFHVDIRSGRSPGHGEKLRSSPG